MTLKSKTARFAKFCTLPLIALLTACGGGGDGYYDDGSSFIVTGTLSNGSYYGACLDGSTTVAGEGNSYAIAQNIASYYGIYYWQSHSNTALSCANSGYALNVIFGVDFYNNYIIK